MKMMMTGICTLTLCLATATPQEVASQDVAAVALDDTNQRVEKLNAERDKLLAELNKLKAKAAQSHNCLLYTSDAADDLTRVDL